MRNAGYGVKDFTAVGELARAPGILVVGAASPFTTLRDLVAAAKAKPGEISFGSSGVGSTNHLPVELFARQAGVTFTHVPYKGISLAMPDVAASRVSFMMATATSISSLIAKGTLRPLAISSETRTPAFPTVPTFRELGYGDATSSVWIGLLGPAGMPPAVLAQLAQAVESARRDENLLKRLEAAGQSVSDVRTPEQFATELRREEERVRRIVREKNLSLE
jgi:tripartite-type tricarboxylate transporter receptor subunit TctC